MRLSGEHVIGCTENASELASHALVIEIVSHHGGPKYVLRIIPVAKLNSETLENILIEATQAIVNAGGIPVALICDNCATNQGVYKTWWSR